MSVEVSFSSRVDGEAENGDENEDWDVEVGS
jgi:hypothetical protein